MEYLEFAHVLWEATKPRSFWTDNKSVTRFFRTKAILPSLWNACDYVLKIIFKKTHIPSSVNADADFLSRLDLNIREKIRLKIRVIQATPIEMTVSSADVADDEQFVVSQTKN